MSLKKFKEPLIYILTILVNIGMGYLLTNAFFESSKNFAMFTIGFILLSTVVVFIIANKLGFSLDLFAYNIENIKQLILNSIFIGNIFSIPLVMFLAILL